jgi:hypothetical protein
MGHPDALRTRRAVARARRHPPRRRAGRRGRRRLGADRRGPALERRRHGDRGQGRPHRRGPRPRGRPRQPRQARPEGPLRLAGQPRRGPADHAAGARERPAGAVHVGRRDDPDRRPQQGTARRPGPERARLLHQRPAVRRGVLHARRDRARRHRHQPPRRQHPALHGDRRGRAEGVLRLRRTARLLHRRGPRRRHRALRPQRRRDPVGALDADARPARRTQPARPAVRRPQGDRGREGGDGPPGAAARYERRAHERAAARDPRARLGRPGVRRPQHRRVRRPGEGGRGLPAGAGRVDLRRRGGADPGGGRAARQRRPAPVHGAAGLLPVTPGLGGRRAGQQRRPGPGDARAAGVRGAADERAADRGEHPRVRRGR